MSNRAARMAGLILTVGLVVSDAAHGGNAIVPGECFIEPPTLHCLGFEWDIQGDDNRNASVQVKYKSGFFGKWKDALPLLRIKGEVCGGEETFTCGNLFAGSILDLRPGTPYKVKLTMADPDGGRAERIVTVRTRPVPKAFEGGRKLHLYPATPPSHVGGYSDFAAAYAEARPGDIILVHAGVHRASAPHAKGQIDFFLSKPATAKRPIVIRGAGDGEAIFNGDGNQLFRLENAHHHFFENLTLRDADHLVYAGREDLFSVGLVVRGCKLERSGFPLWGLSGKCRDFYIADNVIIGPAETWTPREESRKKYGDTHAIWLQGQGHVVCHNRIRRFWDGINLSGGVPAGERSERNCAVDFYNNEISECIDDAIEMDYGVHNLRVMRNFIHDVFMGISGQPVYCGPAYVVRNVVFNCQRAPLKPNNRCAGLLAYHNTFIVEDGFRATHDWQNTQLRNNLFLGRDGGGDGYLWTGTATLETSSLDYNGYRTKGFARPYTIWWRFPEPRTVPTSSALSQEAVFTNLVQFAEFTGYEKHAVEVDYDIFVRAQPQTGQPGPLPDLDLRLRDGAVAVDAGVVLPNINDGFRGQAPDLGAHELNQAVPRYGPRSKNSQ